LFPDEVLGRGEAFAWVERGDTAHLQGAVDRKWRRIERFARRGYSHYVEVSQFFIRTQADAFFRRAPNLGLIRLTRDPLMTARSLANRDKDILAGGPPAHYRQNIFCVPESVPLSRFQVFLHRWIETQLRFHDFVARTGVQRVFLLRTEELSDPSRLQALCDYFGIGCRRIAVLPPTNTNAGLGVPPTRVGKQDVTEYFALLDLLPHKLRDRIADVLPDAPRAAAAAGA
jgi:hypothetical protein